MSLSARSASGPSTAERWSVDRSRVPVPAPLDFDAIVNAAPGGTITIGNLNYDLLALASLSGLCGNKLCDLAYGHIGGQFEIGSPWDPLVGRLLRTQLSDFSQGGGRSIKLVHLHGSLTFLKNPATGITYKFPIDYLRMSDHWAKWRDAKTEWEPQVVLTNQSAKSEECSVSRSHSRTPSCANSCVRPTGG